VSLAAQLQRARDLFSVDPALLGLLSVAGEAQRVPEGAALLSEGRMSHVCFLLVEGAVSLRLERPPRTLARLRARAISPPSSTASNAAAIARPRLVRKAAVSAPSGNGWRQFSRVKPCHSRLKRPRGALKLNSTVTATGA
jgi:hypothetical protein